MRDRVSCAWSFGEGMTQDHVSTIKARNLLHTFWVCHVWGQGFSVCFQKQNSSSSQSKPHTYELFTHCISCPLLFPFSLVLLHYFLICVSSGVHMCVCVSRGTYVCMRVSRCTYVCLQVYNVCMCVYRCTYVCMCVYRCTYVCMCVYRCKLFFLVLGLEWLNTRQGLVCYKYGPFIKLHPPPRCPGYVYTFLEHFLYFFNGQTYIIIFP